MNWQIRSFLRSQKKEHKTEQGWKTKEGKFKSLDLKS
jgi:hypothetical protein